jgi:alpha-L-fucosidase
MDRREFLITSAASIGAARLFRPQWDRPRPTAAQLQWQRDELAMFLHFGVNTFTNREWGDGKEDPAIFNPSNLDARQWARTAKAAGFRAMILTAKHHDGFCLWPTATTKHSVASSPFRDGHGDVVREFVDACRAENLGVGLYLSPWDRNNPAYGDSPRYNDLYCEQLTELLTRYGPIREVWFDGANGEGPNGKKQVYDWPRTWGLVRKLQPEAVIFSDAGPDVRWCGNERGLAGDPNWSTVDPSIVTYPGADGKGIIESLQHGDPRGSVWRPAEVDVSIRPGWFYHPADDAKVRSAENLFELYCSSVGRNGKLLLNVPPTQEGLLHAADVAALEGFSRRLRAWADADLTKTMRPLEWAIAENIWEFDLGAPVRASAVRLEESIQYGQCVARYSVYGATNNTGQWQMLCRGSTIGYAKIDRFEPTTVRWIRVAYDDALPSFLPVRLSAYP